MKSKTSRNFTLGLVMFILVALVALGCYPPAFATQTQQTKQSAGWAAIPFIEAKEIRLTKTRDSNNRTGYEGALVFRMVDSVTGEDYPAAYLSADGNPDNPERPENKGADHAALMFYAYEPQAGMQLGVGPGTMDISQIKSPHVAALRVQRVNGLGREEGMVWISTKEGPFKLAVIKTGTGQVQPFEIVVDGTVVTRYNSDGSKSEFWKGFPVSRHEPQNGSLIYETAVKYPVMESIDAMRTSPVLLHAEPGTECNFKDTDGLIKKAIKQEDGRWTRIADNSYLW